MNSDYDENLRENIFFTEILQHHSDIIKKAAKEHWIICIPRSGTLEASEIDINVILDQVLVPQEDGILKISQSCSTLSKKKLQVQKNKIVIEDFQFSLDVINVLFKETFYDGENGRYVVWCVDKPLFLDHPCCTSETQVLESLPDCIDFLWVESSGQDVLQQIQNLCIKFIETTPNYELEYLQTQKDLIGSLYSRCLQKTLRNPTLRDTAMKNDQFLEKLKLAVETYMQYCLGKKIIFGISTFMVEADTLLTKLITNTEGIKDKYLGLSLNNDEVLSDAICELSKLNNSLTILDKVNCLDKTFNVLCGNKNNSYVTSDDLLQMFVSVILKVKIYNWISNLNFIRDFKFCSSSFTDHVNFLLTTLEAALQYIRSEHFVGLLRNWSLNSCKEQEIFRLVRTGSLVALKSFFENSQNDDLTGKMCHPLCICSNCNQIAKSLLMDKQIRNEKDQTLLVYATIHEQTEIIEYLLDIGVNVNAQDYLGKSALHYASEKGFQDVVLLLISDENIDVNIGDHKGDTPLHLSTKRGNENCVKALIYSSPALKMDIRNNFGETPLHLAAQAGYLQIVTILLENLTYTLSEKEVYKILNDCHNFTVKNYIEKFSVKKMLFSFPFYRNVELSELNSAEANFGIKPKSEHDQRKLHLLMNAIRNNDIPLACFYLGFSHSYKDNALSKCHPLCNCENCGKTTTEDLEASSDLVKEKHSHEEININMCNSEGLTPLHVASQYGRCSLLRILLDCGAQVNIQTYNYLYTPLHLSCLFQQIGVVKELVKCNDCDVNVKDSQGNTPLFYACSKNNSRIIEILLRNDADHEIKNNMGYSVWDVCQKQMLYCAFKTIKNNVKYSSTDRTNVNL